MPMSGRSADFQTWFNSRYVVADTLVKSILILIYAYAKFYCYTALKQRYKCRKYAQESKS